MTTLSVEDCIAWATPERRLLSGYATSEEELDRITEFVTTERRQWLLETFRAEILARSGITLPDNVPPAPCPIEFSDIPLEPVLTREQYRELVKDTLVIQSYIGSWNETGSFWRILAEIQAKLSGHSLTASKYHDGSYKDEKAFQSALQESLAISSTGYPVRFRLDGVKHIYAGALDLASVEEWIDMRDSTSKPIVYWTPRGFWPEMIRQKRAHDEALGLTSYADVIQEKTDNVYVAPYIAPEVLASQQYVTLDDVVRAMLSHGETYFAATRTFNDLVSYSADDDTGRRLAGVLGAPALSAASGAVFFRRAILPEILERMRHDSDRNIARTISKAEKVADYLGSGGQDQDELYERLVFGS